jgi:hypothetical protein
MLMMGESSEQHMGSMGQGLDSPMMLGGTSPEHMHAMHHRHNNRLLPASALNQLEDDNANLDLSQHHQERMDPLAGVRTGSDLSGHHHHHHHHNYQ